MKQLSRIGFLLAVLASVCPLDSAAGEASGKGAQLTFCCDKDNDLLLALTDSSARIRRVDTPEKAVAEAPAGSAVLILADRYPAQKTKISSSGWDAAKTKRLRMFVEYPASLPGFETTAPTRIKWERGVITTDAFGAALPKDRILAIHDCHFLSAETSNPLMVIAKVAGYDRAVYGLPPDSFPILYEQPEHNLIVATTKLSGFAKARYAPAEDSRQRS